MKPTNAQIQKMIKDSNVKLSMFVRILAGSNISDFAPEMTVVYRDDIVIVSAPDQLNFIYEISRIAETLSLMCVAFVENGNPALKIY